MLPMAAGFGEGGAQTAPLGRAVIGGLIGATFATLVILPAIFAILQGNQTRQSPSLHPADGAGLDFPERRVRAPCPYSINTIPLDPREPG